MRKRFAPGLLLLPGMMAALLVAGCGDDSDGHAVGAPTAAATNPAPPTSTPAPLSSAALLQPGPAGVGVMTVTLVDTSRPTMPNGNYPGAPSRTLSTDIWYPTAPEASGSEQEQRDAPVATEGRPFPLIVYSHGFLSDSRGGAYLADHLASYGYVVTAPDFPLTTSGAPGGPTLNDVVNQPGDVSFIISQLLANSATPGNPLTGAIDPERVGLTGLSLGGMTTFLAAFHPTLRDPRVRAAAPMAGPGCFFSQSFFDSRALPLLILHGTLDAIVPYQQNAVLDYEEADPPKYLVTLLKGTHTAFADGPTAIYDRAKNLDDLGCNGLASAGPQNDSMLLDQLGGPAAGIVAGDCPAPCTDPRPRPAAMKASRQHQLTLVTILSFFDVYLRGSAPARQFLEQALAAENPDAQVQFVRPQ